jgi:hypothetical protein
MHHVRSKRMIVLVLIVILSAMAASTAAADPTYTVMNAEGGIYWRSEPNWNAAEAISGFGVYNGTTIAVHCYQSGTSVPGSADTMWEQATDVAGPGYGSGWLNEHFINDGQPINQPSPGVGPCNPPPHEEAPPQPVEEHHEETPASGGSVFPIFNAEGGIYYRYGPHWSETTSTPGVGVYNGDRVELICGAFGDPVGPFNDTAWSYVNNLSRPVGKGWVNEHFINDGAADNAFVSGEQMCNPGTGSGGGGGGGGSTSPPSTPYHDGGSLYYSPYNDDWIDYKGKKHSKHVKPPAQRTLHRSEWNARGGCYPDIPNYDGEDAGSRITTVAAWSVAKNAPFALLDLSPPAWVSQINYIILYDPGTYKEYEEAKCEPSTKASRTLANWLAANQSHHLLVVGGEVLAGDNYRGIQHFLFADAKNYHNKSGQNIRRQIIVCPYPKLSHEDVWINLNKQMTAAPITNINNCPPVAGVGKPKGWTP